MAQGDRLQQQRGSGSGFAALVGIAIKAGYRHAFETTNESVRIKF